MITPPLPLATGQKAIQQFSRSIDSPRKDQPPIEVWGGVECTCNRVGDVYFDQMQLSGHESRCSDLEEFAALGITTLRTATLWERHERDPSWGFTDQWLGCLQRLGLRCIAGLVHHGSGPVHSSLLDDRFAEKLSTFAGRLAERYPWLDAYTPVNEPHTTARFSALYGIWYPHQQNRRSYLTALLNQCKATVLSMQAIRRVNPEARLVQTEDLGAIHGTEELRSTWELMDQRRWLSLDLLCGRVDRHHPLLNYMCDEGIDERAILWFQDHPCPPDVIGVNYYPTSDRYLDHRLEMYPPRHRSAEGPFVDLEAVRVSGAQMRGFGALLVEAWKRYSIPVAITEVHLGGPVEEQIRWAVEGWQGIMQARSAGAQCVALTFWALLGSYYWNQLVTCANGHYEPGVFDVRTGRPAATDLAEVVSEIAGGRAPAHKALARPGWWRYKNRVIWSAPERLTFSEEEQAALSAGNLRSQGASAGVS